MSSAQSQLAVESLCVDLGGRRIVDDVSFRIAPGEIGCLLGPSGCGKTTVLRSIAGFERPSAGRIVLAGEEVAGTHHHVGAEQRRSDRQGPGLR